MERKSLDTKRQTKEKINISLNNNFHEKNYSLGNKKSKNKHKLLTERTNFLFNNTKFSNLYSNNTSNDIHIIKKIISEKAKKTIENNLNKIIDSNPNLM